MDLKGRENPSWNFRWIRCVFADCETVKKKKKNDSFDDTLGSYIFQMHEFPKKKKMRFHIHPPFSPSIFVTIYNLNIQPLYVQLQRKIWKNSRTLEAAICTNDLKKKKKNSSIRKNSSRIIPRDNDHRCNFLKERIINQHRPVFVGLSRKILFNFSRFTCRMINILIWDNLCIFQSTRSHLEINVNFALVSGIHLLTNL